MKATREGKVIMTAYEEQIELGKAMVLQMIHAETWQSRSLDSRALAFLTTDSDFDCDRISVVDSEGRKIVLKISNDDLADCVSDPAIRFRLGQRVLAAFRP